MTMYDPTRQLRIRTVVTYVPALMAVFTGWISIAVLVGWALNIEVFKSLLHPGHIAMNPMTAVAFLLAAVCLCVLRDDPPTRSVMMIARACAAIIVCIGLARLTD